MGKVYQTQNVFNFSLLFLFRHILFDKYLVSYTETNVQPRVKCLYLLSNFKQNWNFFVKFYVNSLVSDFMKICSAVLTFTCGQTDEPSDMGI